MKKLWFLCVLLVFLSPLFAISQDEEENPQVQKARVIVDKANIYLESNPYSIVIDTVGRETIVTLFQTGQKNKKWLYISYYSKKRMAQVTGFIDINLVEIISKEPENPEPPEEVEEKTEEKIEQEEKVQAEKESTVEKTTESQEEKTLAIAEKEESAELEKELIALRKKLKEMEKESGEKTVEEVKKAEIEQAKQEAKGIEATAEKAEATVQEEKELVKEEESAKETEISQEQKKAQETEKEIGKEKDEVRQERKAKQEEKETAEPVKQLIEKIQEEKESVEEAQKIEKTEKQEIAEESKVMTEKKEEAKEKMETKEKGKEALNEIEKQDEEMRMQMEEELKKEETESREKQKEQPIEEDLPEVLTKISVKVRRANIRLMPSLKSAVIHQLPFGVELKPLAKSGNWYRVNLPPNPDGIILSGYIHDSIVNETFEKIVLAPPEPEEIPEDEPEVQEEEPGPATETLQETQPAARTERAGPSFWIGGGAGYTMPSETSFDKGINLGGTLGFGITRYLAVELRVPYFQSDVTGSLGGLSTGQLKAISLTMSVQARYPIKDLIIPYVVGGGDYHLNKFTLDKEIVNSWNALGFDIEENVEHTFGFHFGGGLDFFLFRNLALNLDVRYYTASLKGDWRLADTISQAETSGMIENIKLNSIQAGISVKFFLNR